MQIVEDMSRQHRIEVASAPGGHYVIRIDLAGRFGPFRLAFRARPHVFLLSPNIEDRRGRSHDVASAL